MGLFVHPVHRNTHMAHARALIGALALLLSACGGTGQVRVIPALQGAPAAGGGAGPARLRFGATRVDVTPPPGPSTFGHGPDALAVQGYWTRLQCRVFAFESISASGVSRFALVPCDLPAISYALYRDIAESVKDVIPGDHLLVMATHTHAGPAHYFESPAYSGFLSTRRPGFDDDMLRMLASRIARGISDAFGRTQDAEIQWISSAISGLTRNRSLEAYDLNGSTELSLQGRPACEHVSPPEPPVFNQTALENGPCKLLGRACQAVDPTVHTLDVRSVLGSVPLGRLVFVAVHPTVLAAHTRLFGGDIFGVAARELERKLRATPHPAGITFDPPVGIVNTNEGDVVPAWVIGDIAEARAFGNELARQLWVDVPDELKIEAHPRLSARTVEANFQCTGCSNSAHRLPPPMLGQTSSHGGADHRATVDDLMRRPSDWTTQGPQAPKTPLLAPWQSVLTGPYGFPARLPFAVWALGGTMIGAAPAELTITAGQRLRRAISAAGGVRFEDTVVAGLANGYMQYVTTCEEFQRQAYEGGSNLYGPMTAQTIADIEASLACEMNGRANCVPLPEFVHAPPFSALPLRPDIDVTHERYPQPEGSTVVPKVQGACWLPSLEARLCFRWLDRAPGNLPLASFDKSPSAWIRVRAGELPARIDPGDPLSVIDDTTDLFQVRARRSCARGRWSYSGLFDQHAAERISAKLGQQGSLLLEIGDGAHRLRIPFPPSTQKCSIEEALFCASEVEPSTQASSIACGQDDP